MKHNIFNEFSSMHAVINDLWRYASGEAESEAMRRDAKRQMDAERAEGGLYHLIVTTVGEHGESESVTIEDRDLNALFEAALIPFPTAIFHGYDDRIDVVFNGKVVAKIVEAQQ